jgi:hypothetical protein
MSVLDLARIIIYRFHEKGLEIFLIPNDLENDKDVWKIPEGFGEQLEKWKDKIIDLDESPNVDGKRVRNLAIEGDWHDIPSIRGMIKYDIKLVKSVVKENLPGSERGAFVAVKEAFKKVLPHEYKAIKELKDVLFDRNSVTNI